MHGVKFDPQNLVYEISDESDLTFYDADFNDPPLELREDVEEWLNHNLPSARIEYDTFDIRVRFQTEEDAVIFKTFWL